MDINRIKQNENVLILAVIIIFAIIGLWLRFLPMEQLTSGPVPKVIFMDPWYSMRQIEVIAANLPDYPWFDPMNGYPAGKDIDWGPVYPLFTALITVLVGASTRAEIMTVASWIPPILSLTMIPILYYIARIVSDRKAAIITACLTSVIAGEYLYRSFYGYLDHHFMEVLFSTAFLLLYLMIIRAGEGIQSRRPWQNPPLIITALLTGVVYYLGMMNMPTIVLFAGIIGIFCLIHALISHDEQSLISQATAHALIFGIFSLLYAITGIHASGMSLSQYTPIHLLLGLILIVQPIFLATILHYSRHKPAWLTNVMILAIPVSLYILTSFTLPSITAKISEGIHYFFFFSYSETFINEMQMWDMTRAYHSFNIALLIMTVGIAITGYRCIRSYQAKESLILIWAGVILVSTILHLRYEYYAAVIVILFSAIALSSGYTWMQGFLSTRSTSNKPGRTKPDGAKSTGSFLPLITVGLIILIITIMSAQITWVVAKEQLKIISMNDDWADGLTWLEQHTPEPGIDYLNIYPKDGFTYPASAYGVLSWWDYGHWITYLGKRISITTPFQNNVQPVAKFLVAPSESEAQNLAKETGARYIIIDYEMISSKFASIPLWAEGTAARDRYQKYYFQQSAQIPQQYEPVLTLKPDFFTSMISRLYLFDGSQISSAGANLVRYADTVMGNQEIPVVSGIIQLTPEQAEEATAQGTAPGTEIVSVQYTRPITTIPALSHYRLVYESPSVTAADENYQIHNVKIFERVAGYQINGTGTIELPLITNQGRAFTYRQTSTDGGFTVPYATESPGDGVRATGPYRNIQTGETFTVTEEQILRGV